MTHDGNRRLKLGVLGVGAAAQWYYLPATRNWSHRLELIQVLSIRLYKDDWNTDVAGWQDIEIPALNSVWAEHASTLLSLADAVLDGKPLVNSPRHMAHVIEVMERPGSRQTVDLTTTFRVPSWEEIPLDVGARL